MTFYLGKEKGGNDHNPRLPNIKYTQCGVTLLMQPCSDSLAPVLSGWEGKRPQLVTFQTAACFVRKQRNSQHF